MAVLTRAREQQAVESGERAMPAQPKEMTCKQRTRYNNSGIDAKRAMIGAQQEAKVEGPRHVRKQKSNFKSPTDFYSGPAEAGRVLGGPRRYEGMNSDTVRSMLSDDFHNENSVQQVIKPVGGPQHVDNRCLPLQNDPVPRLLVKPIHEQEGLDAPFAEHNNPKPPRDPVKHSSLKVFPERTHNSTAIVLAPAPLSPRPPRGNRSNDSKELSKCFNSSEPYVIKKSTRIIGPVKWTAPEMDYPKRRAAIRTVNSTSTDCHDVLGNGRFGNADVTVRRGLAAVDTVYKDQDSVLVFPDPVREEPKPVKPNTIVRYFDPSFDDPSHFKSNQKPVGKYHPAGKTINSVSTKSCAPPRGKGKGEFAQGNSREFVIG